MKAHYNITWAYTVFLGAIIASAVHPVNIHASDSQTYASSILGNSYLTETYNKSLPIIGSAKVPDTPEFIGWNGTWRDLYVDWGVDRQFLGHKLTVKLGFIRGDFDSYTQTYKAEPVVTILDNSIENSNVICSYLARGASANRNWTNAIGPISITISFNGQAVTISNSANPTEQITVSYSELLAQWTGFASRNARTIFGTKYYVVPQSLWVGGHRNGFVVTTNSPLYYTTGLPQDFIELYKQENSTVNPNYKPVAYSLALRLAFVLLPDQKNTWEIRPMTPEEVGEAILEGARTSVMP